jgi:hypothetical protein
VDVDRTNPSSRTTYRHANLHKKTTGIAVGRFGENERLVTATSTAIETAGTPAATTKSEHKHGGKK